MSKNGTAAITQLTPLKSNSSGAVRCRGKTRNGHLCEARPLLGSSFCYFHAADKAKERRASQSAGGRGNRRSFDELVGIELDSILSLAEFIKKVMAGVLVGAITPKAGNALGLLGKFLFELLPMAKIEKETAESAEWSKNMSEEEMEAAYDAALVGTKPWEK